MTEKLVALLAVLFGIALGNMLYEVIVI